MEGTRVSGQGFGLGSVRFWRLAVFAATGTLGVSSQAEAAIYYWQDSTPAVTEPAPAPNVPVRRAKTHQRGEKKSGSITKESKPQGPLIISISIALQKLRLYDANGLFAETPVSTGMPGHSTPMGVFSVIQKQKFHQSNIYSGAPMPFMQRITWSGIAIHAGVLPGHPASHGCIRMPMAFAIKMYGWTRMGARVIVTPGEVTPTSFSHPLLASVKVAPQPVAAEETKADAVAVQTQEPVQMEPSPTPTTLEAKASNDTGIELRSTIGHADDMKAAADALRVKTADASGALSKNAMSDAVPAGDHASREAEAMVSDKMVSDEAASSEAKPVNNSPVETEPAKAANGEAKPVGTANARPAKAGATASETTETNDKATEAAAPADVAKPATTMPAAAPIVPLKEDLKSDFVKTYLGPPLKKTEQISIFVSRKDSKLYVRQNFSPLFDVPVTIAADERPLGTHIFTAQVDKNNTNVLRWSVVSLPAPTKAANRRAGEERTSRNRRIASAGPIEAKPLPVPDNPTEALDRLSLPAEIMARIYEAVSTGGSIIISDQGIAAGETGEGTDFIVSLR
jgi:lipoprotein-anchoring transpeptidase ErfK/SrfK